MTTSVADFIETLRSSRLLEPARVDEILRTPEAREVDAPTLGQCMVQLGWLTTYQVDELLQGRAGNLSLGPYRVEDRLGDGPAFKARHPEKDGRLVLKLVQLYRTFEAWRSPQLEQTVRAATQLAHPNIARVGGLETIDGATVYVREYVEGTDLARLVHENGPLPPTYACDYIHQAAQALEHAHEGGLAHGHLQPSNLIVVQGPGIVSAAASHDNGAGMADNLPAPGAVLKIVDFGLSPLHVLGPPTAAPPLEPAALRQEIGDLGRTFAYLLSGQTPLFGSSVDGMLSGRDVPEAVRSVLRKMLSESADGFPSAGAVAEALAPLAGTGTGTAASSPGQDGEPVAAPTQPVDLVSPPPFPLEDPSPAPTDFPAVALAAEPSVPAVGVAMELSSPEPNLAPAPLSAPPFPVTDPTAEAFAPQPTAPPSGFVPSGYVTPEPTSPLAAPVGDETLPEVRREPPRQRAKPKYGARFYLLAAFGLLLHVVAAGILVIAVLRWMEPAKPTTIRVVPPKASTDRNKPNKAPKEPGAQRPVVPPGGAAGD